MARAPNLEEASESGVRASSDTEKGHIMDLTTLPPLFGILGLLMAGAIYRHVVRQSPGSGPMIEIAESIHTGAMAFLKKEYSILAWFIVAVAILLALGIGRYTALAFVGGMILNLMPCVFPVLSLKILSFAQHHGQNDGPRAMRAHGLFYATGVVVSFLALAGVLLALKAAGNAIGWGFQLQEPAVVWVLATIFFLIGLNLMGGFEFATLLPQRFALWRGQHPAGDAFGAGVLAVVVPVLFWVFILGARSLLFHEQRALAGDLFDFFYRSNSRNLKIIRRHLDRHYPATCVIEG